MGYGGVGKEKSTSFGAKPPLVNHEVDLNGITAGVVLNVHMKTARGPQWQWEVQWANITEEGQSVFIWPKPNFYGSLLGPILRLNIKTQSSFPTKNYSPTPHIYLTSPRSPSHKSPISPYLKPHLLHSHQLQTTIPTHQAQSPPTHQYYQTQVNINIKHKTTSPNPSLPNQPPSINPSNILLMSLNLVRSGCKTLVFHIR